MLGCQNPPLSQGWGVPGSDPLRVLGFLDPWVQGVGVPGPLLRGLGPWTPPQGVGPWIRP